MHVIRFLQEKLWSMLYELITDIDPNGPDRTSGILKPTRFAKFIHRVLIGKEV